MKEAYIDMILRGEVYAIEDYDFKFGLSSKGSLKELQELSQGGAGNIFAGIVKIRNKEGESTYRRAFKEAELEWIKEIEISPVIKGLLAFDVDSTLALRDQPLPQGTIDKLIILLKEGMKIAIITGQSFVKQKERIVNPIPDQLRRNMIIYANESSQKFKFDTFGKEQEDMSYRKGFSSEEEKRYIKLTLIPQVIKMIKEEADTPENIRKVLTAEELFIEDRVTQLAFKYPLHEGEREFIAERIREFFRTE